MGVINETKGRKMKLTIKQIEGKLRSIGVNKFAPNQLSDVTWVDLDDRIQIDFWNIDRVIPCKYNSNETDLVPMGVSLLYRKNDRINANAYDHYFRDISEASVSEFMALETVWDLKDFIYKHQSVGIRLVA